MEQNSIDASLGLAIALDLLKQHQETGELRGNISIAQFLSTKHYRCIIQIENGQVVSCTLLDEHNQRRPADKEYLIQTDNKGGPFDWKFYQHEKALSVPPTMPVPVQPSVMLPVDTSTVRDNAVPIRLTPALQLSWLSTWNPNDIRFLQQIFSLVNGHNTIHDIKLLMFRFPPEMIEKAFIFLIAMKQVEIQGTIRK
ncbi:MAG TPA: hypothetical protein VL485_16635 [Ktedonobacteraceae bacterium]|nr:hypothetical protein [Ktedonobacteraceae bacterium]